MVHLESVYTKQQICNSLVQLTLLFLAKTFKQFVHIQKVVPLRILTTKRTAALYKCVMRTGY